MREKEKGKGQKRERRKEGTGRRGEMRGGK